MKKFSKQLVGCGFIALFTSIFHEPAAHAQATLEKRAVTPVDICANDDPKTMDDEDASSCAEDAMFNDNTTAFFKWAQIAASKGDYVVADWIADKFEDRKEFVYAYMWYDLAAQFHAQAIRQEGPSTSPLGAEDNSHEIQCRDGIATEYHLTPDDKAAALRFEKDWLSAHGR